MRATAAGLVRTNHSILTFLFELAYRVWSRLFFQGSVGAFAWISTRAL